MNKTCIFPFQFGGVKYGTCTSNGLSDGTYWCPTSVDKSGRYVDGKWGKCSSNCPMPMDYLHSKVLEEYYYYYYDDATFETDIRDDPLEYDIFGSNIEDNMFVSDLEDIFGTNFDLDYSDVDTFNFTEDDYVYYYDGNVLTWDRH